MSEFTDQHRRGVRAFTKSLEHKHKRCENCGFEGPVLHSDWKAHVESDPRSGHIQYRLTCPDCNAEALVDIDI